MNGIKIRTFLRWAMIPVGSLAGYAYYAYIGCQSGACAMASDALFMTIYGGVLGYFIGGWFQPKEKRGAMGSGEN